MKDLERIREKKNQEIEDLLNAAQQQYLQQRKEFFKRTQSGIFSDCEHYR